MSQPTEIKILSIKQLDKMEDQLRTKIEELSNESRAPITTYNRKKEIDEESERTVKDWEQIRDELNARGVHVPPLGSKSN